MDILATVKAGKRGGEGDAAPARYPWRSLDIGQGFLVKPWKGQSLSQLQSNLLAATRHYRPKRFKTRKHANGILVERVADDPNGKPSPIRNLTLGGDVYEELESIRQDLKAHFGFLPTTAQTIQHLLKERRERA